MSRDGDFLAKTKRLLADRAGHQCSLPTCNRRTVAAGATGKSTSSIGFAAHIYSASPDGPRGQGGLTAAELMQPENGIWLCSGHAKLVDNNRGQAFSAETLRSYKALQEARIVRELEGLYPPIGWVHALETVESPVIAPGQRITFAKLNLLIGENNTGKTALTEWLIGAFDHQALSRWRGVGSSRLHYRLHYFDPKLQRIEIDSARTRPTRITLAGTQVPFNPLSMRVYRLSGLGFGDKDDDLTNLSSHLGVGPDSILNLVDEIHSFPHARVRNLVWKNENGRTTLFLDCDGTVPGLPLRQLSGREVERVFIEFATAAARCSGRYCPTLLILDGCPSILFDGFFEFYSHHLLDPGNQFQTVMCIPTRANLDLDAIAWHGWEVIRLQSGPQGSIVSQSPRTDDLTQR